MLKRNKATPSQPSDKVSPAVNPAAARLAAFAQAERGGAPPPTPAAPPRAATAAPAASRAPAPLDHGSALQKAVDLFTFLRELVSLRTTVVRNISSYDRVLWIEQVPKEPECESSFRSAGDEETRDWWLHVRKPAMTDPPAPPETLLAWVDPETISDSSIDGPQPLEVSKPPEGKGLKLIDHPEVVAAWDRYVDEQWLPWATEDRRKRKVLRIYTDLFSLYQQQRELGESYEVIIALGQLRWSPKPGVEVNRHVVAVQTNIEFDSQKGVITLGPAADGARPRLEEDMLELDERPAPDVLTALEQQVAACDDDIWHNDSMTSALKSFVHSLGNGQGTFSEEMTPLDRAAAAAQMRWAPALILRRRTEQGLLQVYGKILEDLKKRTELPPGLTPLVEVGWQSRESQVAAAAGGNGHGQGHAPLHHAHTGSQALLFPLHFNDEQLQIVHRLQHQCGVVVQGPPGTGKSHTIANLVCHLLATGNRVLVTSHAPRALRILKDKIPQAITNMCVVLLGNDRTAMTELEQSVQVITQQLNAWDPRSREQSIKELEGVLSGLHKRASEVDGALRAIRESDTHKHPEMPGGYAGTLQQIAETLRSRQEKYAWIGQFTEGVDFENLPPDAGMLNSESTELLKGLRSVDAQRRKDFERDLPKVEELLTPEAIERTAEDENQWRQMAETAKAAAAGDPPLLPPELDVDQAVLKELCGQIDAIVKQNGDMEAHYFAWVPKMARDIRAGQVEQWRVLLEKTHPHIAAIRQQPEQTFELDVAGIGEQPIEVVRDDAKLLFAHVKRGGKIKSLFRYVSPAAERQYVFRYVQINGQRVKGLKMLAALKAWAEVQVELTALATLWTDVAEQPHGPVVRRIPVWNERCSIIASALQMHDLIQKAKAAYQRLPDVQPAAWHDPEKLRALLKQLKALLAQKEFNNRRQATDALAEQAAKRAAKKNAHPLCGKVAEALKARSLEAYKAAYAEVGQAWAERENWTHTGTLLKQFATRLPKAAEALSDEPDDASWDGRLARYQEAWLWFRADQWLKRQLDPRHFEHLQAERKGLQDHQQAAMVKLAAAKAWYYCMQRMTPTEETYLKAWMQAVRNIGAGTGKRADRFRKVARTTLEKCRSAIPAWIMPIHRLAETVTPGEDQFDVVIVDEASQSGAEALFLHYIAKKIIIVGDDKQIAPYNVGINRDDVELLRHRHIKDLPLSDYFDLEHSFFDQAYLRFGNRIRLCEHFRCMPEIIQFSNKLCYSNEPLLPLRQYGDARIEPVVVAKHVAGHMEGTSPTVSNKAEADAIVKTIAKLIADPQYKDKTFGVISMLGDKQARLIEEKLLKAIGPEEMERRRLICGDAYSFQGDERNVMFISLVVAADEGRRLATLTQPADERRFNVAASRARDQMWLFHSVMPDDLSPKCLRRQFLEYCMHPQVPEDSGEEVPTAELEELVETADRTRVPAPPPFKSWLEVDVFLQIARRGYRVLPQHAFAGYRIDLVVTGTHGRLAVECDGQDWGGPEQYDGDMERQRQFERCGWRFWRIRGGTFYRNPEVAMEPLWELLEKQGIEVRQEPSEEEADVLAQAKADAADVEPETPPARKAAPAKKAAAKKPAAKKPAAKKAKKAEK